MTPLQQARLSYQPRLPRLLKRVETLSFKEEQNITSAVADADQLRALFPHLFGQPKLTANKESKESHRPLRVGVVLSGGQAAGGHNVISGLHDALLALNSENHLFGFLGGPSGIVEDRWVEITGELLSDYRNQGGFDMIGSGRTKIETPEQLEKSRLTLRQLSLNGLVIIGGDDSNTNAAVLAEYLLEHGEEIAVVGVPKTIDGDLKNSEIEVSFGFDTACKIYAELIGNLMRDALSAKKYTHFVKLMGRSASHIALECALSTHPNYTLIGEEVAARGLTLKQITSELTDLICRRAAQGKNFGLVLVPEGAIEFIPEVGQLIREINAALAHGVSPEVEAVAQQLTPPSLLCFQSLPGHIREQLLEDRDPHGNVQVSHIATEQLLIEAVREELSTRTDFKGKFSPIAHFFGYEGRSALPSNFDADYCYGLGYVAALLISMGKTGYMAALQNLCEPAEEWQPAAISLTSMMRLEERKGKQKPVIVKSLVDLSGSPFVNFAKERSRWATEDDYQSPGPIQFFGGRELTDLIPITLRLERAEALARQGQG
jgi:diphosphate-dependent phosphofructokinase